MLSLSKLFLDFLLTVKRFLYHLMLGIWLAILDGKQEHSNIPNLLETTEERREMFPFSECD
jgi:hypothetical protein